MATIQKAKVTLTQAEIEAAIKNYIHEFVLPKLNCTGGVEIKNEQYGGLKANVEVEALVLDPLSFPASDCYYKLRHRDTKLFVESMSVVNKKIILGVGLSGNKWHSIPDIFVALKKATMKKDGMNGTLNVDAKLSENLKEDLLHFEIVYYGETKVDDITFHINELGKI